MPFIQIGSGLAEAGNAAASYQQMVGPAVQGLSQAMTNVQQLRQSAARDVAQQAMQQDLMGVRRAQIALSDQEFQADQVLEQRKRASAEMAERTKLAAERGKLAEQARSLGFPVSEEGTAGLLAVLQQEDPDGFEAITSQFAEALPNGIENEEQVTALWRASADTLMQGRSMRAAADKQGRAAKVLGQVQQGSTFWQEEDALALAALAEDPNVSAAEYRAEEEQLRTKRQQQYVQASRMASMAKRAMKLVQERIDKIPEERMDAALSILGDFEAGDVKDPEAQILRLEAITGGLDSALGRIEEEAFARGREVGMAAAASAPLQFAQGALTGIPVGGDEFEAAQQRSAELSAPFVNVPGQKPMISASSKLAQGLMSEAQRDVGSAFTKADMEKAANAPLQFVPETPVGGSEFEAAKWRSAISRLPFVNVPGQEPMISASSKLAQGLMSEAQREAMRIRASMKAQGLNPASREDFDKFMQAERARAEAANRAAQRGRMTEGRGGKFL